MILFLTTFEMAKEIKMKFFGQNRKQLVVLGVACVLGLGCSPADEGTSAKMSSTEMGKSKPIESVSQITVPKQYQPGEDRFNTLCARCHGIHAKGTKAGPPLVHKIYEPSHHGDFAFLRAAAQGVRAHHWKFGNMPKIVDATPEDVKQIIPYVRWLQREAGIY